MILVDTSIWIDHLHRGEPALEELLAQEQVAVHPLVIEELALGSLSSREQVLSLLSRLRSVREVSHRELMMLVKAHSLFSRGLSVVDARLIGSVLITPGAQLWTRDKRMRAACSAVGGTVAPYE